MISLFSLGWRPRIQSEYLADPKTEPKYAAILDFHLFKLNYCLAVIIS